MRRLAVNLAIPTSSSCLPRTPGCWPRCPANRGGDRLLSRPGAQPIPCLLRSGGGSWRDLLLDAHRVEAQLLAARRLSRRRARTGARRGRAPFEAVVDPNGVGRSRVSTWAPSYPVGMSSAGGRPGAAGRHRRDAVDAGFAGADRRIPPEGLELMTADPDADPAQRSLLSADEIALSAGRPAGAPPVATRTRFHELFEQRVAGGPACHRRPAGRPAVDLRRTQCPGQPVGSRPCWIGDFAVRVSSLW